MRVNAVLGSLAMAPGSRQVPTPVRTWFAPVAVAVVAGLWLDRKYARRAPRRPANPATPTAVTRSP